MHDRKVRITPTQLHSYYVTWFEGKKQKSENVGSDALTAWRCKLNREAIMNGAEGAEEHKIKHNGNRVTVADAIEVFLEDVKAGKSPKTHPGSAAHAGFVHRVLLEAVPRPSERG